MPEHYMTLSAPCSATITVKRSTFLADLHPVGDEPAARAVIDHVRREHRDARHHCTAFILGPDAMTRRSNDDGEPSGTAGAPMLEALAGAGDNAGTGDGSPMTDVVAVVTRWFGGVLLGTGGLARAYGDAVRAALAVAEFSRYELRELYAFSVGHDIGPRIDNGIRHAGFAMAGTEYDAHGVTFTVGAAPGDADALRRTVNELTGAAVDLADAGTRWVETPN